MINLRVIPRRRFDGVKRGRGMLKITLCKNSEK
jgi:hypothetical protein